MNEPKPSTISIFPLYYSFWKQSFFVLKPCLKQLLVVATLVEEGRVSKQETMSGIRMFDIKVV